LSVGLIGRLRSAAQRTREAATSLGGIHSEASAGIVDKLIATRAGEAASLIMAQIQSLSDAAKIPIAFRTSALEQVCCHLIALA
jgi:hypothetical protein